MRALAFDYPILPEEQFVRERFTDEEWLRPNKPNGSPYSLGGHFGIDCGKSGQPVFAGVDGTARWVDHGSPLGIQVAVQWAAEPRLWLLFAHLDRRTVENGRRVRPDTQVGVVGGTGGVPPHLHFTVLVDDRFAKNSFHKPVQALNDLKGWCMVTIEDIRKVVAEETRKVWLGGWYLLTTGTENDSLLSVPSSDEWRKGFNLKAVSEKLP